MKELAVCFDGQRMGTVRQTNGGQNSFTYAASWLAKPAPTPSSSSLPLNDMEFRGKKIENFLWGLLPDNEIVIGRWAHEFRVSSGNPFGLLANVGRDAAGAVSFVEGEPETSGRLGRPRGWPVQPGRSAGEVRPPV